MPSRRDPASSNPSSPSTPSPAPAWGSRSSTGSSAGSKARAGRRRARLRLPQLPRPSGHQLAVAGLLGVGAVIGANALGLLWPKRDNAMAPKLDITPATLAEKPARPVTVLVIGTDADSLGAGSNGAAPPGPANADALLLVRVNPRGPLQVLNLPVEVAVKLPGDSKPQPLGALYRKGGVALTADATRELVGLNPPKPDRYLVLPRSALRDLINGIGGLEINPARTMKYTDKAQKYTIDLQAGLQRLGGAQVEQLVRYRDKWLGESDRRKNQQQVETALRERLKNSETLANLPNLLRSLQGKVDTNLSPREALSLLAAGLDDKRPIEYGVLPLDPAKKSLAPLRQRVKTLPAEFWKEPVATPPRP